MAGKITIRRIGSILPTLCLLLVFVLCMGVLALSTLGFPGAVLRYIENRAAEQGITLRMEALYLYPSRGLALRAEGVEIFADAEATQPLATIGSLSAGLNASHFVLGSVRPAFFMLTRGQVQLPVTDPAGKSLDLRDITCAVRFERGERAQITSGFLRVQGIPIRIQGSCDLSMLSSNTSSGTSSDSISSAEPLDIGHLIAEHQDIINEVYRYIDEQHWTNEQLPSLNIGLAVQEEFRVSLSSRIPSLNLGQFHFRDAEINLQHNKDSITINSLSFRTVDPEASANLQGG